MKWGEHIKIRFRRKSKAEWITLFAAFFPFTFGLLLEMLRLPALIRYAVDVAWIILLIAMLCSRRGFPNAQVKTLAVVVGLFFAFSLVGFFANFQSIFYYLWGMRNNVRFFVFFFACIFFLKERSVQHYFRCFDMLFWINACVVLVQYFFLGKSGDYLGGIFGVEKGCNGYTNILFLIVITRTILQYMNGKEKAGRCIVLCIVALAISVLSELKVFVVELLIIVILAAVMTKFAFKRLVLILVIGLGAVVAAELIAMLFPHFAGWFNLESILSMIGGDTGYASEEDLNRLTAVPIAWERFLTSWGKKLFGLGLGNCDYAAFDFLTSPFYLAHQELHYVWFSSSFLILETGAVGLILYTLFFVCVFMQTGKVKKTAQADTVNCQLTRILAIMCLVLILYNGSLRTEAGFMMYFVLAIPFIPREEQTYMIKQNV